MFLINWGELTSRWDPVYLSYLRQTRFDFKFPTQPLRYVTNSFSGGTPSKDVAEYWNGNIPWASPKDIKEFYLSYTEDYITEKGLSNSSSKLADRGAVLLVVRSGILQHTIPVSVCMVPMAINQDIKVLIPNNNLLPEFLAYYFIVLNKKVLPRIVKYSTTVQSINTFELEKLPIPLPSLAVQQKIVSIMNEAYEQKKKKVQESEDLLKSINDYILNALRIYLPTTEQNGLSDRIFYIKSNEVFGQRLDPSFYFKANNFRQRLMQSEHPVVNFNDIITSVSNGVEIRNYQASGYRYLRVSDMSANGIVDDHIRFVETDGIPDKIRLSSNDIIISRSGSLGLVNVVTDEILDAILSSHIFKVSIVPNINVNYLQEYLRSTLGQIQFFRNNNGGIIPEINQNALKKIKIVLPSKDIQDEIAQFSINTRNKANELIDEADKIISNAKQEAENILLGDK